MFNIFFVFLVVNSLLNLVHLALKLVFRTDCAAESQENVTPEIFFVDRNAALGRASHLYDACADRWLVFAILLVDDPNVSRLSVAVLEFGVGRVLP